VIYYDLVTDLQKHSGENGLPYSTLFKKIIFGLVIHQNPIG